VILADHGEHTQIISLIRWSLPSAILSSQKIGTVSPLQSMLSKALTDLLRIVDLGISAGSAQLAHDPVERGRHALATPMIRPALSNRAP